MSLPSLKKVGLVGGIAPESTIDYYRSLIAGYRARVPDDSYPPIVIDSIDLARMLGLIGAGELDAAADYLAAAVNRLAAAGADFAALASNTPHIVFDAIQERSRISLLSIVAATRAAAEAAAMKRVALFGTRFTMQAPFYPSAFARRGIVVVAPTAEEQAYIHEKYMGELVRGVFLPETRHQLLAIVGRMRERERVDGVILGGTELPLLLREPEGASIALLDTTAIHVEAILAAMLTGRVSGG